MEETEMSTNPNSIRRTHFELEILYKISHAMVQQHGVSALLNEVLDIMETEMGFSRGTLTFRQSDTDAFTIEASRGLSAEEQRRGSYALGEGVTGAMQQRKGRFELGIRPKNYRT